MVYEKHYILAVVVSIVSVGMVLSESSLLPQSHQIFAQLKTDSNTGMNVSSNGGGNNNMTTMMSSMQKQLGMNSDSMDTNMTMVQMLDMMDMMHNMMMNMMRMMAHSDTMKGGNMTSDMTTMGRMQ